METRRRPRGQQQNVSRPWTTPTPTTPYGNALTFCGAHVRWPRHLSGPACCCMMGLGMSVAESEGKWKWSERKTDCKARQQGTDQGLSVCDRQPDRWRHMILMWLFYSFPLNRIKSCGYWGQTFVLILGWFSVGSGLNLLRTESNVNRLFKRHVQRSDVTWAEYPLTC